MLINFALFFSLRLFSATFGQAERRLSGNLHCKICPNGNGQRTQRNLVKIKKPFGSLQTNPQTDAWWVHLFFFEMSHLPLRYYIILHHQLQKWGPRLAFDSLLTRRILVILEVGHVPNILITSVGVVQCINIAMFTGGHHTARITEVVLIAIFTPQYDVSQEN